MPVTQDWHQGTVRRLTATGLGFLEDQKTRNVLPFTFDLIPDYRGQTASEIGLRTGLIVQFRIENGNVKVVKIQKHN